MPKRPETQQDIYNSGVCCSWSLQYRGSSPGTFCGECWDAGLSSSHRARASGGRLGATPYFRSWQSRSEKAARDKFAGVDRFWNGSVIELKGLPVTQVSLRDRIGKKGKEDDLRTCSISQGAAAAAVSDWRSAFCWKFTMFFFPGKLLNENPHSLSFSPWPLPNMS